MAVTGTLLVLSTGGFTRFREAWLAIAVVVYVIALSLVFLVQRPTLKRLIALATVDGPHFKTGTSVSVEITIEGTRQDVADAALAMSRDIFYASHNWQPFFAEGTKTLAYELWEQLGFRAPDSVVVPAPKSMQATPSLASSGVITDSALA